MDNEKVAFLERHRAAFLALGRRVPDPLDLDFPLDPEEIERPRWEEADRIQDWRNHVPIVVRAVWGEMTFDVKLAIYAMAEDAATPP